MNKILSYCTVAAVTVFCACSGQKGWKVDGTVANAPENAKVAVEGFNGARWYCIDSVAVSPAGAFSFTAMEGSPYPDVYRLGYNGRNIYFPIDSLDAVTVTADASHFDQGYELTGTQLAEKMLQVDNSIAKFQKANPGAAADSLLKRKLSETILADSTGIIAYYLINKTIGGKPMYDPANRSDLRIIGAIANKFASLFPNDPRTGVLTERFIAGRKSSGQSIVTSEIQAPEISLFEIELFDNKGQKQSLEQTADKNTLVVLSFTTYDLESSPAYNVILNNIYEKNHANGLQIYQVGFDGNEVDWHEAAANLPWITVYGKPADRQKILTSYNVGVVPMTFIIKDGSIVERVIDPKDLAAVVAKYL